jgi:AcrR family transcriptional regulator
VARSLEKATQRSIDRGAAFLRAASSLLQEAGAAGFTVQQVADLAGQSLRTFYQHFASKDDLLLALLEEELAIYVEHIRAQVAGQHDPVRRLVTFVTAGVDVERSGHAVGMSRYRVCLAASHPDESALVQAPLVGLARDLVGEAIAAGAIPPRDPDAAAYMIVTMQFAYVNSSLLGNELGTMLPTAEGLGWFCALGLGATDTRQIRRSDAAAETA